MNNVNLDYRYLDHERLELEGDVVYRVNVLISGPVLRPEAGLPLR